MARSGSGSVRTPDGVVVGAGLLAFVSSFLPWYSASFSVFGVKGSASVNAWSAGFTAWFSVLLLVVAGGVVLVSALDGQWRLSVSRRLVTLGLAALALVAVLLRWMTFSDDSGGLGEPGHVELGGVELGHVELGHVELGNALSASSGAGSGLYLGLVAAVVALVASLPMFRGDVDHTS